MMSEPLPRFPWQPVTKEEFGDWFDSDGRLVKEITMRQRVFEVGIHPSCRRKLWKFLFNIYPMSSTYREQKTIDIENRSQFRALCHRWEILDRAIQVPDDDLSNAPPYMELSDGEEDGCSFDFNDCPPGSSGPASCRYTSQPSSPVSRSYSEGSMRMKQGPHFPSSPLTSSVSEKMCRSRLEPISMATSGLPALRGRPQSSGSATPRDLHTTLSSGVRDEDQPTPVEWNRDREQSVEWNQDREQYEDRNLDREQPLEQNQDRVQSDDRTQESEERNLDREQPRCECDFRRRSWREVLDEQGRALLGILEFPSKVFAARQPLELERSYGKAKRIILRDVLRTDRNYHYFSHKRNLRKVHRILLIFAMFHPDTGYAQGMNDLLARFLVVTDSEVDSYWMFVHYMQDKRLDFLEHTMMRKVALVKKLISEIDRDLFLFFEQSECHDFLFCHRWLLLDFKREFQFEDSLRVFEVLGTHYLELYSDKAQVETDKAIAKEFLNEGGEMRPGRGMMNFEFTFDLFISAAILTLHRDDICQSMDAASVYGCLNGLSMNMELSSVLAQAVELCLKYCRQTVCRGFSEVDI